MISIVFPNEKVVYGLVIRKVTQVSEQVRDWEREDARDRFDEVLDEAKAGRPQRIKDADGMFEVTFSSRGKIRASDVLSRPGPADD